MSREYVTEKLTKTVAHLAASPDPFPKRLIEAVEGGFVQTATDRHVMPAEWQRRFEDVWNRIPVGLDVGHDEPGWVVRDDLTVEECEEVAEAIVELALAAVEHGATGS